ncbi:MAG: AAA family ATPase, partial [Deltaproteobacteria bacterium]|nr:AAA family ATPase [Deltaproteobacteria bacterium]
MENKNVTSINIVDFATIIGNDAIYVDKTEYLANIIDRGYKSWLLFRPMGFGKSLTMSTLKSIFSGDRELFRGLAIEKRLHDPLFAPRPVIHLDMGSIETGGGIDDFEKSLNLIILDIAKSLGVEVDDYIYPSRAFYILIVECHKKYGFPPAILIDDYDAPVRAFLDAPYQKDQVINCLDDFYIQLKANAEHISFVFVTGITKIHMPYLSGALNNLSNISFDRKCGPFTGFTHEEILLYYQHQIREAAKSQMMSEEELLNKIKEYYYGYCYDRQTYLYNPYRILHFFEAKDFSSLWFESD